MILKLVSTINILVIVITPFYFLMRTRMSENATQKKTSPGLLGKFITTHILVITGSIIALISFFIATVGKSYLIEADWYATCLMVINIICLVIVAYGGGLYSGAIVHEEYTSTKLTTKPDYPMLKAVELFMHGPMSHVMMFQGSLFSLLLSATVSSMSLGINIDSQFEFSLIVINGIISGVLFAASAFYSYTWRAQLPFTIILALISLIFIVSLDFIPLSNQAFVFTGSFVYTSVVLGLLSEKFAEMINKEYPYSDIFEVFHK